MKAFTYLIPFLTILASVAAAAGDPMDAGADTTNIANGSTTSKLLRGGGSIIDKENKSHNPVLQEMAIQEEEPPTERHLAQSLEDTDDWVSVFS